MTGVHDPAVLAPISGDPGEVRRVAAGLAAQADLLATLARTVRGLADPALAVWSSPAGEAFARRAGAVPGVLERVGHRYGVAASALRRLADALQDAQSQVAWAQRVHEEAWGPFLQAGDQMGVAESSADPGERLQAARYRAEMVAYGERVQLALRRHAAAHDGWAAADRECAGVLRGLLDDGLADSRLYDALTGTGRVAGEVSDALGTVALLPPLRPLAAVAGAAGGLGLAAEAVVRVGYGDGDLGTLALSTAAVAAGGAGPVLKAGARATNAAAVGAATTRSARRALRLTSGDRLAAGFGASVPAHRVLRGPLGGRLAGAEVLTGRVFARKRLADKGVGAVAAPAPRPAQPWTPPPRSAAALRPWVREQTVVRATTWARRRWVDDLTAVTRAEGASTRWHVAGLVANGTGRGLEGAAAVREHALDAREQADLRDRARRHR